MTGDRGLARQLDHLVVAEGADEDAVHVAAQHLRGVGRRLAAPHLGFAVRDHEGVAAELRHSHLGADPGPGRTLAEDHGQGAAPEGAAGELARLDAPGQLQEVAQVRRLVGGEVEEVTRRRCHGSGRPNDVRGCSG